MRNQTLVVVLSAALAALLSSCADRGSQPPLTAAAPSTDAPVLPDEEPPGPVSLESAFGRPGAELRELNPDELEAVSAGMSCSLDSVNSAPLGVAAIAPKTPVLLSGWFQHDDGDVQVVAVLKGDATYIFPMNVGAARPDVAQVIGAKSPISDVTGTVGAGLPAGEYAVYYVRKAADGLAKCVADKKVRIG